MKYDSIWVVLDKDGEVAIFPGKPKKNKYGYWEYLDGVESEVYNRVIYTSPEVMKKLIGRVLTKDDDPVEVV